MTLYRSRSDKNGYLIEIPHRQESSLFCKKY